MQWEITLKYSWIHFSCFCSYQVSITPAGVVYFVSKGYEGLSSDGIIFSDCGVILKFSSNSACMVDGRFNVDDLLLAKQWTLYKPPSTKGQVQLTKAKVLQGQAIAKAIEHAIQHLKWF